MKQKLLFLIPVMLLLVLSFTIATTITETEYNKLKAKTLIHGAFTENCTSNIATANPIQATITGTVTFDADARACYYSSGYLIYANTGGELTNTLNQTMILFTNTTSPNDLRMFFGKTNLFGDEGDIYIFANGPNDLILRFDNGVNANGVSADFYANKSFKGLTAIVNTTGTTLTGAVYYNSNRLAQVHAASAMDAYANDFRVGRRSGDATGQNFVGHIKVVMYINYSILDNTLQYILQQFEAGDTNLSVGVPLLTFSNDGINNTAPKQNDTINVNITLSDDSLISGYVFSWDNGTGTFKNDSFVDLSGQSLTIANASVNKTIEVEEGTIIQYQWWANNIQGKIKGSSIFSLTIAGTTPPNVTIHGNNFFASDNSTIISLIQASSARLNFTFNDNIDLFGFVINITCNSISIFNFTNLSLNGMIDNFTQLVNVESPQGICKANITVADTHTAKIIPEFEVRKGFSWLEYDSKIRIEAEGAIWASTKKYYDRYDFIFNYIPFFAPKNKVFYIESDGPLIYQRDSIFKAHFVDYKNRKWIDFEGLEGQPKVTKITDYRWKIEFTNSDSQVIFNSIGGLNEDSFQFEYYLSNVSISFFDPEESQSTLLGTSFSVSLNITGNGRNETRFRLYNSSKDLIATANVSATGTGTYFYNTTFTGLSGTQFFVNATHIDVNGQTANSTTITLDSIQIEDCSAGFPAINFTIRDELNDSRVRGDSSAIFDYNGTVKSFQFTKSFTNQDNFSICIFPTTESLIADYEITYEATSYPQRVATVSDILLNNITKTADIFLLRTVDGIFTTFRIIDSFQNPLSGVTSSFAKAGTTIETRLTDDAGIVSFFVNPDTTYIFTFTLAGFRTSTNSLRVTTADIITVTLESEAEEQVTSFSTGISYFFFPQNQILNNNTDFNFRFNLTSSFWDITGCTLRLRNASQELAQGDCQFNASQSKVSIIFNTGNQSIIFAEAEWEINNTFNSTAIYSYAVRNVFVGASSLRNFLNSITNFAEAGFNDFNRFLIAILITLFVVGGLSLASADFREPEILIPVTWLMVAFFSYLGWMNIPLDTIPQIRGLPEDWLNRWNVFILISLLGGAYLIRKHIK